MFKKKTTTEDEQLVTKGYLREEFEKFARFILEEIDGRFQKSLDTVVVELKAVRAEMRQFHQTKDVLQRNDVIQERKIEALEERVLALEISNK
jgi:polyhydroxyalkanoate synthesis regulator phasin